MRVGKVLQKIADHRAVGRTRERQLLLDLGPHGCDRSHLVLQYFSPCIPAFLSVPLAAPKALYWNPLEYTDLRHCVYWEPDDGAHQLSNAYWFTEAGHKIATSCFC